MEMRDVEAKLANAMESISHARAAVQGLKQDLEDSQAEANQTSAELFSMIGRIKGERA